MPFAVYIAVGLNIALVNAVGSVTGFEVECLSMFDAVVIASVLSLRLFPALPPVLRVAVLPGETMMLVLYASSSACTLSYAVQTFHYPYQDAAFQTFDHALGFNYTSFMRIVTAQTHIYAFLRWAYEQVFSVPLAFIAAAMIFYHKRQIAPRFITAFVFATMLTCVISAFVPAQGAVILLDQTTATLATGASPLDHLEALRNGSMTRLPSRIGGIVSFPSMHVGLGLLLICFSRGTWLIYVFTPFALLFMVTSMTHGAHYLADGFAALPTVAVAVFLSETLHRLLRPIEWPRMKPA